VPALPCMPELSTKHLILALLSLCIVIELSLVCAMCIENGIIILGCHLTLVMISISSSLMQRM
jgi:hypothetical protein